VLVSDVRRLISFISKQHVLFYFMYGEMQGFDVACPLENMSLESMVVNSLEFSCCCLPVHMRVFTVYSISCAVLF